MRSLMLIVLCVVVEVNSGGNDKNEKIRFKIQVPKLVNKQYHTKTVYIHVHDKEPQHHEHDHHHVHHHEKEPKDHYHHTHHTKHHTYHHTTHHHPKPHHPPPHHGHHKPKPHHHKPPPKKTPHHKPPSHHKPQPHHKTPHHSSPPHFTPTYSPPKHHPKPPKKQHFIPVHEHDVHQENYEHSEEYNHQYDSPPYHHSESYGAPYSLPYHFDVPTTSFIPITNPYRYFTPTTTAVTKPALNIISPSSSPFEEVTTSYISPEEINEGFNEDYEGNENVDEEPYHNGHTHGAYNDENVYNSYGFKIGSKKKVVHDPLFDSFEFPPLNSNKLREYKSIGKFKDPSADELFNQEFGRYAEAEKQLAQDFSFDEAEDESRQVSTALKYEQPFDDIPTTATTFKRRRKPEERGRAKFTY